MRLKAMAKINLGLDVLGKREDGYHEVRMIMQTILLYDILDIRKTRRPGIVLTTNLPFIPTDQRNLVYKAAQMLMEEFRKDIVSCRLTMEQPCFHMSETVQQSVRNAAQKLALAAMTMDSGAGHDSMSLSQVTRVGMIFVPSVKGISHSKEEFTTWDDVTNGANVHLHALCDNDRLATPARRII